MRQTKIKEIRLAADLQTDSIVDGPGLRAVLWTLSDVKIDVSDVKC